MKGDETDRPDAGRLDCSDDRCLGNGWILAGLGLLVAHLGLYMLALKSSDLSFALPLTAASYPLAALSRDSIFTRTSAWRGLGTLLITLGVAIVVLGDRGAERGQGSAGRRGVSGGPAGDVM